MKLCRALLFCISTVFCISLTAGQEADLQIHLKPKVDLKADVKKVLIATIGHSCASTLVAVFSAATVTLMSFPIQVNVNHNAAKNITRMCISLGAFLGFAGYYFKNFEIDMTQEEFNSRIDAVAKGFANKRAAEESQDRLLLVKEAESSADATGKAMHIVVKPVNIHPTAHERKQALAQVSEYLQAMPARLYGLCCSFVIAVAVKTLLIK